MNRAQRRVGGAFLAGLGLVALALFYGGPSKAESEPADNSNLVVGTPLRTHLSIEDRDGNGIPDWQEALIRTETLTLDNPDNEAYVPETVTARFGANLLEKIIRSKFQGPFGFGSHDDIIDSALNTLTNEVEDKPFTRNDLNIVPAADETALRAYGNALAQIMYSQPTDKDLGLTVLEDALQRNSPERLKDLLPLQSAIVSMQNELLALPVPSAYADLHLDYINIHQALAGNLAAMQQAFDDPLYAFVRVRGHREDAELFLFVLGEIYKKLTQEDNLVFTESEPMSVFSTLSL